MSSELLPNDSVPEGFEIVIGNADVEMGKVWNLWFNVTLSDDPRKWDGEIRAINDTQKDLEGLSDQHRLIRAHMAELCRYHPSFPNSIDCLCEEIGKSVIEAAPALGCEGRGLLQSLGYHQDADVDNEVWAHLRAIGVALRRWRDDEKPKTATDRQVFLFLGERTEPKREFTGRLLSVLRCGDDPIQALRELTEGRCRTVLRNAKNPGRPFNCFNCLPANESCPECKCSYVMLAWAGILCADRTAPDNPPEKAFQRFVQEHVLTYAAALDSWISEDRGPGPVPLPRLASLSETDATDIAIRVHESLGEKNPAKTWLVASLLKTIVGNQRWHKGRELIDDFPEVTSSLRRLTGNTDPTEPSNATSETPPSAASEGVQERWCRESRQTTGT